MSILSLNFIAFVITIFILYYILPSRWSPYVLLAGSVVFYLCFDLRYSLFLLFSVVSTFFGAIFIEKMEKIAIKKAVLSAVLILNIGVLFFVKFVPWLIEMSNETFKTSFSAISVLVPVGISFYTLQVLGYCIDVYKSKYKAEKNIFKFASFATFFPLMLQGPISRYDQLSKTLFQKKKVAEIYENLTAGAQLALWGFFKKLVIADRAALLANMVFDNHSDYSGFAVILAAFCYTIQIYTDFSGCVDICRGVAKVFGVDVIENFKQPYFSVSIQDFWKRWHIALSSWFRDYIYISLGGNRKGVFRKYVNLIIVFLVSGLWHGVGFHFIIWGLLQAFYQIVGILTLPAKKKLCSILKINRESQAYIWFQRIITFSLVNVSWVFFRGADMGVIGEMLGSMFRFVPGAEIVPALDFADCVILLLGCVLLLVVGHYREKGISIRESVASTPIPVRWTVYLVLFLAVLVLGIYGPGYSDSAFIYMNF